MVQGLATDKWKKSVDDYVVSATELLKSIARKGIREPIPIDPDGELLNGSHRVACAVAYNLAAVIVIRQDRKVWAPAWDLGWFMEHNMPPQDVERMMNDWALMNE